MLKKQYIENSPMEKTDYIGNEAAAAAARRCCQWQTESRGKQYTVFNGENRTTGATSEIFLGNVHTPYWHTCTGAQTPF